MKQHDWILAKFNQHFKLMHSVALKLLRCLAIGLKKRPDYFEPWFMKECSSTYRAIHYNPRAGTKAEHENLDNKTYKLVTPEHCDSGFMTLLTTFMYDGLQVEINGEYKSIKPMKNAIVMNIGEILAKISNFTIKATRHRVYDIGLERYSSGFFLEPKFSAKICDSILASSRKWCEDIEYDRNPANAEEMKTIKCFGEVMCKKLTGVYGEW